jgi:PHD/YefM family antitoxin component YafN of YafNO toxin-antitoxin module
MEVIGKGQHDFSNQRARRVEMIDIKERYVIDEKGKRTGVIIDIKDYKKILDELEELESIRAYDSAKSSGDEAIPFENAFGGW